MKRPRGSLVLVTALLFVLAISCADNSAEVERLRKDLDTLKAVTPSSTSTPAPTPPPTVVSSSTPRSDATSIASTPRSGDALPTGPTNAEVQRFKLVAESLITRISYYAPSDEVGRNDQKYPLVVNFFVQSHTARILSGEKFVPASEYQVFVYLRTGACARDIEETKVGARLPASCWEIAMNKVDQWDALPNR